MSAIERTWTLPDGTVTTIAVERVAPGTYRVTCGDRSWTTEARRVGPGLLAMRPEDGPALRVAVDADGTRRWATAGGAAYTFDVTTRSRQGGAEEGSLASPMPGKVVSVAVAVGDMVEKGQALLVVEAMKMEHAIVAPRAGRVAEVLAEAGDQVEGGAPLARLEAAEGEGKEEA